VKQDARSTEPRWLEPREQSAWRAYLDMNAKLTAKLNREMQEQAGISIADFSVLVQLSEHVDGRMRVLELARALGWEKSRLSHQLSRMQQRGLVERANCNEDRRGAWIALTDRGQQTIDAAAPQHVEAVRKYVFDPLDTSQVGALDAIARAVVGVLDTACAGQEEAGESDCGDA
jgi:DNA-binding MarR family transcriptional regulator